MNRIEFQTRKYFEKIVYKVMPVTGLPKPVYQESIGTNNLFLHFQKQEAMKTNFFLHE